MKKAIVKSLLFLLAAWPLKVHRFNARILAFLLENVIRYRRDDVIVNLSRCFPDEDYAVIKRIRKEFYIHFANLVAEAIWFGGCRNPERLVKAHIATVRNPESLIEMDTHPAGMMILCSHCGNWEMLAGVTVPGAFMPGEMSAKFPVKEWNIGVSYRQQSGKVWDEIIRDNRFAPVSDKHVPGYLETKSLVRFILSHQDSKFYYHMITDQRPYLPGSDRMEVDFLGQKSRTMSAAASLAHKTGMPVMFLRMRRDESYNYVLEYVPICPDASVMEPQEIMDRYYELLNAEIREQPFNYLWTHRRWPK